MNKALVLLSGGMDSTTVLALVKYQYEYVEAISFDYGQKHKQELDQARMIADHYKIKLNEFKFEFADRFNKSTIIYAGGKPLGNDYMPFRNMIIFAVACGYAQAHGFNDIHYGANADDVFPDNLEPFLIQFNKTLESMQSDIRILYPLYQMKKDAIVNLAIKLEIPLLLTRSCYLSGRKSCGKCLACQKRLEGFLKAGVIDPIEYD